MAKRCPCANPPGGDITCSDDQLGVCGIMDGKLVVGCFDPPAQATARYLTQEQRQLAINNWALTRITGVGRSLSQEIEYEERQILRRGEYANPQTGDVVKFSLPRSEEEPESQASPMAQAG
jgi:hypothetical protein